MPDQWYAVIDSTTGEALSFGTVLADPLPAGTEAVEIDHQPGEGERWNPATRTVVLVTDQDRIAALTEQRDAIDAEITRLTGE